MWLARVCFHIMIRTHVQCIVVLYHFIATGEVMPDSWYRQIGNPEETLHIAGHIQNLNQNRDIPQVVDNSDVTSMDMVTDESTCCYV